MPKSFPVISVWVSGVIRVGIIIENGAEIHKSMPVVKSFPVINVWENQVISVGIIIENDAECTSHFLLLVCEEADKLV